MKTVKILISCVTALLLNSSACTTEKNLFKNDMWTWHWQKVSDTSYFFSLGSKPIGRNEIWTPQFFFSTRDSIFSNFHMENLEDFDHKERWKLIKTSEDQYIGIQELDDELIEVFGPVEDTRDFDLEHAMYRRMADDAHPPFSDSILYSE